MKTPRYKVIEDYPKSPFAVGQILELEKFYNGFVFSWYEHDGKVWMTSLEFDEYPNIFKKLND
jgi:hypothetical protein